MYRLHSRLFSVWFSDNHWSTIFFPDAEDHYQNETSWTIHELFIIDAHHCSFSNQESRIEHTSGALSDLPTLLPPLAPLEVLITTQTQVDPRNTIVPIIILFPSCIMETSIISSLLYQIAGFFTQTGYMHTPLPASHPPKHSDSALPPFKASVRISLFCWALCRPGDRCTNMTPHVLVNPLQTVRHLMLSAVQGMIQTLTIFSIEVIRRSSNEFLLIL